MLARALTAQKSANKIRLLATDADSSAVADFLDELDERTFTESYELFEYAEQYGPPKNAEKFRRLDGPVAEFKVHRAKAVRYIAVRFSRGWLLVQADSKKRPNALQRDIKRAKQTLSQFVEEGEPCAD